MLTFELFEHCSKSKLKSEILLYYKVKKTLHVLNLPNGWIQFIIIYAKGWNLQSTVWLNHHTSFQPSSWTPGALYPKLTLTSYPNNILDNMMAINKDYMLNKFGTSTCCTKNQTMDYHKLPRTNIASKNLSNTLKDIFPS